MPKMPRAGGLMGRLTLVNQLVGIVREMRVDEVRRDAEMRPVMLIVAPDRARAADLSHRLIGWSEDRAVTTATFDDAVGDLNRFDLIVAYDPDEVGRVAELRRRADRMGTLAVLVRHDAASLDDEGALNATRKRIVEELPERAVAFGRAFPPFRSVAVSELIRATARSNAQFALIANIPSVIPVVGSLFSAGADLLVLTKNQVLLLFKIAAVHGRDLRDTVGIIREMVPVVGSGLLWRTLAREAVGFLPFMAGTIPKVAIAYAGTFAVGHAADYYYRFGHGPTRAQRREYYTQAAEHLKTHDADLARQPDQADTANPNGSAGSASITEQPTPDATAPAAPATDATPDAASGGTSSGEPGTPGGPGRGEPTTR